MADQFGSAARRLPEASEVLADAAVLEIRSGRGPNSGIDVRSTSFRASLAAPAEGFPLDRSPRVLEARRLSLEPRVRSLPGFLATPDDLDELERIIDA